MAEYNPTTQPRAVLASNKKITKNEKRSIKHNKYSLNKEQSLFKVEPVSATITYGGGECDIDVNGDVYGIEIHYFGKLNITSRHLNHVDLNNNIGGWIMSANNETGKLIYFSFNSDPINGHQRLFEYKGDVQFNKIVVAGDETQIRGEIKKFTEDNFSSLNINFNKVDRKFRDINYTNKAKLTAKNFTGFEVAKTKNINKKTKTNIRRNRRSGSTGSSQGGSY